MKVKQKIANELKWERIQLGNFIKLELEKSVSKSQMIVRNIHLNRLLTKRKRFDSKIWKKDHAENFKKLRQELFTKNQRKGKRTKFEKNGNSSKG